jgi:adenylate kinase
VNAVILLGPPGAGKGTVSGVLEDTGYIHVSTGQMLREQIKLQTPLGNEARKLMEGGNFVSDEIVLGMIRDLVLSSPSDAKFLFDGFPRTLVQAEEFDALLDEVNGTIRDVILLECPEDVIVKRISGRRTCMTCGAVYHVDFNMEADGKCGIDGCDLMQRPDDTEETVRKRIAVYEEWTAPLIGYYSKKGLIKTVDANQDIEAVRNAVSALLEKS